MKALPLFQPYATLVAVGAKRYETRHYPVPLSLYGERFAIYATKGVGPGGDGAFRSRCLSEPFREALAEAGYSDPDELPRGAIVCTLRIREDLEIDRSFSRSLLNRDYAEYSFGNYELGRYAWVLEDVERCDPIACTTNHPGVFELSPTTARALGEDVPPEQLALGEGRAA